MERRSDREVVVTRWFDAPARLVFEAGSKPDPFKRLNTVTLCILGART